MECEHTLSQCMGFVFKLGIYKFSQCLEATETGYPKHRSSSLVFRSFAPICFLLRNYYSHICPFPIYTYKVLMYTFILVYFLYR